MLGRLAPLFEPPCSAIQLDTFAVCVIFNDNPFPQRGTRYVGYVNNFWSCLQVNFFQRAPDKDDRTAIAQY